MSQRQVATTGVVVVFAAAALWWVWPSTQEEPPRSSAPGGPKPGAPISASKETWRRPDSQPLANASMPTRKAEDPVTSFERWVQVRSSLRGAEMDGDWGKLDAQGRLMPSRSVRYRFDQLLTLQGEVELRDLGWYVSAASHASIGENGGAQVEQLWKKYLELLSRDFRSQVNLNQPAGWAAALQERRVARREVLGPEWAEQFFGEEERAFESLIRQSTPK
jgi:hypothetical protein